MVRVGHFVSEQQRSEAISVEGYRIDEIASSLRSIHSTELDADTS